MATEKDPTVNAAHTNPDAITGAPGSHPGATGIGSASGATVGAVLGAIGGPVGAIIGGVAGAAVGGGVGHSAGEANDPSVGNSDDAITPNSAKRTNAATTTTLVDRDLT